MKEKSILRKKTLLIILAAVLVIGIVSFLYFTKQERRINRHTDLDIDISGCKILEEKDTHSAMSDGEYLLVLDCGGEEEKMLEQTRRWQALPMGSELQSLTGRKAGLWEKYGVLQAEKGAWYFYDRFPGAIKDRHSDEGLLSRPAMNFSLLFYDYENSRLLYYECDT